MKQVWINVQRFLAAFLFCALVTAAVYGWMMIFHLEHKWASPLAVIPAAVFMEWFFWIWAKARFDMYVETVGKSKVTYVRIAGDNFVVPQGQELVIRQSEDEPGKLEVFKGPIV
jgi:hypothetical protein